jgi:hypothetical protein
MPVGITTNIKERIMTDTQEEIAHQRLTELLLNIRKVDSKKCRKCGKSVEVKSRLEIARDGKLYWVDDVVVCQDCE